MARCMTPAQRAALRLREAGLPTRTHVWRAPARENIGVPQCEVMPDLRARIIDLLRSGMAQMSIAIKLGITYWQVQKTAWSIGMRRAEGTFVKVRRLVERGMSDAAIAAELGIAPRLVRRHKRRIWDGK